ncbi:regulator of g protein signaling [Anaeramoeba ignava]|uniref:Regulator of g protein signaling n=1 Tax=Anaeramoeba ignava TaxID=1746090 RepID=A0A9Q0LXT7_ANAIG|nr:regulator of g protein signaling [Anaeramoeba ignava]
MSILQESKFIDIQSTFLRLANVVSNMACNFDNLLYSIQSLFKYLTHLLRNYSMFFDPQGTLNSSIKKIQNILLKMLEEWSQFFIECDSKHIQKVHSLYLICRKIQDQLKEREIMLEKLENENIQNEQFQQFENNLLKDMEIIIEKRHDFLSETFIQFSNGFLNFFKQYSEKTKEILLLVQDKSHTEIVDMEDPITEASSIEFIFRNKYGRKFLGNFLKKEFCFENLDFFIEVENYKKIEDPIEMHKKAQEIYNKFVKENSESEINIEYGIRNQIKNQLPNADSTIFDQAKQIVIRLIKTNSLSRFLESEDFEKLIQRLQPKQFLFTEKSNIPMTSISDPTTTQSQIETDSEISIDESLNDDASDSDESFHAPFSFLPAMKKSILRSKSELFHPEQKESETFFGHRFTRSNSLLLFQQQKSFSKPFFSQINEN